MNPLFRIGTRVKVKTWDEIAAYTGVDFTEEEFHTLYGVVYDEANDDPIGLLDECTTPLVRATTRALSLAAIPKTSFRLTIFVTCVQARWWNANRVRRTSSVIGC